MTEYIPFVVVAVFILSITVAGRLVSGKWTRSFGDKGPTY